MLSLSNLNGTKNPFSLFSTIHYNRIFKKEHPTYFEPDGTVIFCGPQGSGKTLSAVNYVRNLTWAYPKVKLVTNVDIKGLNPLVQVYEYEGIHSLTSIDNGYEMNGILLLSYPCLESYGLSNFNKSFWKKKYVSSEEAKKELHLSRNKISNIRINA